jgi:hypothetical protein
MTGCQTTEQHCENCGSTSPEDVGYDALRRNDGYTDCCNELATDRRSCRGHHLDLDDETDDGFVGGDEPMSIFCEDCGGHDSPTHDCSLVTR